MYNPDYIGYKNSIGASGGISAAVEAAVALMPIVIPFFQSAFTHPAADARDFISKLKPKLATADPYNRMVQVIAGDKTISEKAKDVSSKELVLWYRQNYPNDYKTLSYDDKVYWNNYVINRAKKYPDNPNGMADNYADSRFTTTETNVNATPLQKASNLFSSSSTSSGATNWVLYGALAIGAIFLIKYIKK